MVLVDKMMAVVPEPALAVAVDTWTSVVVALVAVEDTLTLAVVVAFVEDTFVVASVVAEDTSTLVAVVAFVEDTFVVALAVVVAFVVDTFVVALAAVADTSTLAAVVAFVVVFELAVLVTPDTMKVVSLVTTMDQSPKDHQLSLVPWPELALEPELAPLALVYS